MIRHQWCARGHIGVDVTADTYNTDGNGVCQQRVEHPACLGIRYICLMQFEVTVQMLIQLTSVM